MNKIRIVSILTVFLKISHNVSRLVAFANPTNCVLSAKIKFLREKRITTQEKPASATNRC
jgi:hypothetical protein